MERTGHPRNITGGTVRGEDLFGRDGFLKNLERGIDVGNLLLLAPRRWGKSSVLQTFFDADPARRRYLDVMDLNTPEDFVVEVAKRCEGLSDRVTHTLGQILENTLGRVKSIEAGGIGVELGKPAAQEPDWKWKGERLMTALGREHVLILDEFPVLAKRLLDADEAVGSDFLMWLRTVRQRPESPRFIFAGSTSLSEVCAHFRLSQTINDLDGVPLPPFDERLALDMLRAVFAAEGVPASGPLLDAILDQVGPEVPYFLQLMAKAIIGEYQRTHVSPAPARVVALYKDEVLSARTQHNLEDYWERIDRIYTSSEAAVIREVLSALSKRRDSGLRYTTLRNRVASRSLEPEILDRVLPLMGNDFYVRHTPSTATYSMFNRCLADWWRIYHGGA